MTTINQTQIVKDLTKRKLVITRHFDGSISNVWKAWSQPELLDQWWAPKPWRAESKSMNFKVGGHWLYAMVGPDNSRHWSKVEYTSIDPQKNIHATDMFCDENGNKNNDFPSMSWKNEFQSTSTGTKVIVEISFSAEADLKKIVEMGFEAGFTAALSNLDELLAK
jgi:PhnB protein